MNEITLENQNYLLVEIPSDAIQIKVFNTCYCYCVLTDDMERVIDFDDMETEKKFIGKIADILKDEEICKGLVEIGVCKRSFHFKNYLNPTLACFIKATDSFLSWTQSIELDMTKNWVFINT